MVGNIYIYIYGNGGFFDQAVRNLTAIQARDGYGVYGSVTVYNNYESYVDDYRKWLENRNEWLIENWDIDLTEQPPETTIPETTTPEVTTPEPTAPEVTTPEQTTPTEPVILESDDVDIQGFQMNTDNAYVKSFQAEIGTYANYVSGNGDEEYNNYYALSFKETSYSYDSINTKYAFRAYAILDDGTQNGMIVYGRNIYSTNIYEIAKDLYDNCKMAAKTGHDFLYNNVLNLVAIQQNRDFIADAMKAALEITSANGEKYNLVNEVYNDLYYYVYCIEGQRYTYSDRGTFKPQNGETETKLLGYLNQATNTVTKFCQNGYMIRLQTIKIAVGRLVRDITEKFLMHGITMYLVITIAKQNSLQR